MNGFISIDMTKKAPRKRLPASPTDIRDLNDVKMRLMVNSMKIKLEKEAFLTAVLPGSTPIETAVKTNINRIDTYLQYATIAMSVYHMIKNGVNFFKSFKKS